MLWPTPRGQGIALSGGCYGQQTPQAIKSSADTAAAAAAAAAAANIPSMKHLQLGADDLVDAMQQKRAFAMAEKKKELSDASVTVALMTCYGQHRRSVARSNWLMWPTPQANDTP